MESKKCFKVKVTQLKISKPFLKIHAQNLSSNNISQLNQLRDLYKKSKSFNVNHDSFHCMFVARVGENRFERVRVLQVNDLDMLALVYFIDTGYQGTLRCNDVS